MNTMIDSEKKTNYATRTSFYMQDLTRVEVWLEGEDLDRKPQLIIDFMCISDKYIAKLDTVELSDGIPTEDLKEVIEYAEQHCKRLNLVLSDPELLKYRMDA